MQTPDSIEAALARLMPPALSESGQRSIEAMLDELAATAPRAKAAHLPWLRWSVPTGIAAALAAVSGWFLWQQPAAAPIAVVAAPTVAPVVPDHDAGLVLVSESSRVEEMLDEGLVGNPEGSALQAVRFRVVETNTFRDEESGIEVQVSEPREETLLMPVSVF